MSTVKHIAITFATTALVVAVIFRVAPLRKLVTNSAT